MSIVFYYIRHQRYWEVNESPIYIYLTIHSIRWNQQYCRRISFGVDKFLKSFQKI